MAMGTCTKGYSGNSQPKIGGALLVAIIVLDVATFASARFSFLDIFFASETSVELESEQEPSSFMVDLMHALHIDSPYAQPELSFSEEIKLLVRSSKARWKYLAHKIAPGHSSLEETDPGLNSPLHSVQGSYVMRIAVGTPPRTFLAFADTGSDLMWLQCSPCIQCFKQPDPLFDPSQSASYTPLPCKSSFCEKLPRGSTYCSENGTCLYSYSYGDYSGTRGELAYENFTMVFANKTEQVFPDIGFGCGTENGGTFRDTDGLMGLGRGPTSLISQLGPKFNSIFSYCLVDYYSAKNVTSSLIFGSAWPIELTYTPLLQNKDSPTFYYLNLTGITIAGNLLDLPQDAFDIKYDGTGGTILDSGTTVTSLLEPAYSVFEETIAKLISYPPHDGSNYHLGLCYNVTSVPNPTFPQVVFKFEGLDIVLPDENLFVLMDDGSTSCLTVTPSHSGIVSIFGNIQQQNFKISYNLVENKVGFAPSKC